MKYICTENDIITSVLNYEPNVPDTVKVYEIDDLEFEKINNKTHYFDVTKQQILDMPDEVLLKQKLDEKIAEALAFLQKTDWKVLRHIREKSLGIDTTLNETEYLTLEQTREAQAEFLRAN